MIGVMPCSTAGSRVKTAILISESSRYGNGSPRSDAVSCLDEVCS
jgi:hypothetical protein